ncbi:hypothetical protein KDC22_14500 [Paenibacillus tritici]|uniref:hyaluronate lyase N-terminal domain-containing protein n=1 Tax=Paenibacillus tritici TaxID=1873425 RepID=UPI001BAA944B|nr:hypothetical protein [Paenibacillus tritici]QUL57577.1 hypothetical protein KDC22_14500 [Paenibacillus tritici]
MANKIQFQRGTKALLAAHGPLDAGEPGYTTDTKELFIGNGTGANTPLVSATSADITYYVRTDGNDSNTGLANTAAGAFKTIGKAISVVPRNVNHFITINVAPGTYAEIIDLSGFSGSGQILVTGDSSVSTSRTVHAIKMYGNSCFVTINGFNCSTPSNINAVSVTSSVGALVSNINSTIVSTGAGLDVNLSNIRATSCNFSNKFIAVNAVNASVAYIENFTGSGNTWGNRSTLASVVTAAGTRATGTNGDSSDTGILNYSGVTNPWGDNTVSQRDVASVYTSQFTCTTSGTFYKMPLGGAEWDSRGSVSTANSRFVCKNSGIYEVTAQAIGLNTPSGTVLTMMLYRNGSPFRVMDQVYVAATGNYGTNGTTKVNCSPGDYLEVYVASSSGGVVIIGTNGQLSYINIQQMA